MPTTPAVTPAGPIAAATPTAASTAGAQPDPFGQVIVRLTTAAAPVAAQNIKPAADPRAAIVPATNPAPGDPTPAATASTAVDPVAALGRAPPLLPGALPVATPQVATAAIGQGKARATDKAKPADQPADGSTPAAQACSIPPLLPAALPQPVAPIPPPTPAVGSAPAASVASPASAPATAQPATVEPATVAPPTVQPVALPPSAAQPPAAPADPATDAPAPHQKDDPADDPPQGSGLLTATTPTLAAPNPAAPALHSTAPSAQPVPPQLAQQAGAPPPASPTAQAAAAVGVLLRTGESAHQLTLRLDPAELGHLQIAITRPKDAPPSVALTVERPETLLLLLRDQPALHRALDQAGVPADGRNVSFQLAAPSHNAASHDAGSHADAGGFQGAPQNGGWQQGQQTPSGAQDHRQPPAPTRSGASRFTARPAACLPMPARQHWRRTGVDITA
ncbi:MAG TPA: flagellar hook-length control protein FliK [Acetobacteraceae bacterium]|nr:flagellar hook-length control protein FliK [Acetobacteraceae bacterium]